MRIVLLTSCIAATILLAIWDYNTDVNAFDHVKAASIQGSAIPADAHACNDRSGCVEAIKDLELYVDPHYSFSVAVPAGWRRIIAAEDAVVDHDDLLASLEPGYAVGFESPREGESDRFADYILIEVLPGDDIGLFETSDAQQHVLRSGKESITYDRLEIDAITDDVSDVDLVIFQRGIRAFGYTLGFYAIGEPSNEKAMFDAFQVLLRTYEQTSDPFVII